MTTFRLNLLYRLNQIRLDELWRRYGMADPRVIAQSQRVDKLCTELQRRQMGA